MEYRITLYYYIGPDNQQCGPVHIEQLVPLGVTPETFIWKEGMTDWQQAKFVEDLNNIWDNKYYNLSCSICRLDDSAICKDCKNGSLFSLCESISPDWVMRKPRHIDSSIEQEYIPISAIGWLIAAYVFAFFGGLLGIVFGISIWIQKVESNGMKVHKYKKSHRQLGGSVNRTVSSLDSLSMKNTQGVPIGRGQTAPESIFGAIGIRCKVITI